MQNSNVLELPKFIVKEKQRRCRESLQKIHNNLVAYGFEKQRRINIMLWTVIILLTAVVGMQSINISQLKKQPQTIQIIDDGSVDLTGLNLPPLKPL